MPPTEVSRDQQESLNRQAQMCKAMSALPPHEAIGVACSVLIAAVFQNPVMLRRVLNEPVVREGFRGESLIKLITRVAKS